MAKFIPPHPKKGSAAAYAWSERMRQLRAKKIRSLGKRREKEFFGAERNPSRNTRRVKNNPIALYGNPPAGIHARVSGILYREVCEIRARKTGYKRGFYRHPFESSVVLLALDNGDLLVHSTEGHRLWMKD